MAESIYLAGTLMMGLLIVGVVALMVRGRSWYHYTPQAAYGKLSAGHGGPGSAISRTVSAPSVWTATFFLLALGLLAGVTVYVGGGAPAITGVALIAALGGIVVLYLVGGVFVAMREHDRSTAEAVAASAATLGGLFILSLAIRLVLSG